MPINLLNDSPLVFLVWVLAILISLSVHEFSHALAGYLLGDTTARSSGRLTLNPFAHIDIMGFIMLLFIGFGWGKPVPFNPYNLKYQKWGPAIVALAGPVSNLVCILFFGIILKILLTIVNLPIDNLLVQFLSLLTIINTVLLIFNLIPIPPLDGSKVLFSFLDSPRYAKFRFLLESRGPIILILIVILDNLFGLNVFSRLFGYVIEFVYRFI